MRCRDGLLSIMTAGLFPLLCGCVAASGGARAARPAAGAAVAATAGGRVQAIDLGRAGFWSGDRVKLELAWIPPGAFVMGSPPDEVDRYDDETPHRVTLTAGFWLGVSEVTQAQWARVMGENPSTNPGAENPVENVSWADAQAFVARLNAIVPGGGFRLPTEAEWEYACRAGTTNRFYSGGDADLDGVAWYGGNSGSVTHPVRRKRANAHGLYDLHGNVWEWCQDVYGLYPAGSVTNPAGPATGSRRVGRGGGQLDFAAACRSAVRYKIAPDYRTRNVGLRVARTASAP